MIYVGIDVAKDKHDCFIVNSEGEVLYDVFTIGDVKAHRANIFTVQNQNR